MQDRQLSPNFKLSEFIYSDTAIKNKIDNTPNEEIIRNITLLTVKVLQPIRSNLNIPISISSGYRNPEVNRLVGGSQTSDHVYGRAADIKSSKMLPHIMAKKILALKEVGIIIFDQLILEPSWVHISYRDNACRNQVLTYVGKNQYAPGLV